MKTKKPTGFVLYDGPSLFDGSPIIAVAIVHSDNAKTGDMVQTHILRRDVAPHVAVKAKDDGAVCGTCPLAGGGGCYVLTFQGPLIVWNAFHAGLYPIATLATVPTIGERRAVRLGAYGDPASVPVEIWRALVSRATSWTGYTHAWRIAPALREFCMASADTLQDARDAWSMGWRTYRIADAPIARAEIQCPNDTHGTQCIDCGLCNGASSRARSIVIAAHGARKAKAVAVTQRE